MKKVSFVAILALFLANTMFANSALAVNNKPVYLYFFYGDGCPHCAKEEVFLKKLEEKNKNITIKRYEVWGSRENAELLSRLGKELKLDIKGVPVLIVGDQTIVGYYNEDVTGSKISQLIDDYSINGCTDIVAPILTNNIGQVTCQHGCAADDEECIHNCGCSADQPMPTVQDSMTLPFFGEVQIKSVSLPLLTVMVGIVDGFNPCAMWVLLFLISLLLGMQDRGRMWTLGILFIFSSAIVYFLFLAAWLNIFLFLGVVLWVRVIIALVALGSGGFNLYGYYKNRDTVCVVEKSQKRKMVFEKLRAIAGEKNFWLAAGGIMLLAFAVNLAELVCSAGLPAVYTQVLTLSDLPAWKYYGYLLLYILFFMIDDMLVFVAAMMTLKIKVFATQYTKYSGLVGGLIMVLIGLLLLFKPGWLMFG